MWSTEAGSGDSEAGIWQGGGGLVSDGSGRIIVATGNGISPAPGPGNAPPGQLAESVVRLARRRATDRCRRRTSSPRSTTPTSIATTPTSAPAARWPSPTATAPPAHPHLLVEIGKDGRLFLLDRDNLGGTGQGPATRTRAADRRPVQRRLGAPGVLGRRHRLRLRRSATAARCSRSRSGVNGSGRPALTAVGAVDVDLGLHVRLAGRDLGRDDSRARPWSGPSTAPGSDGSGGQLRAYCATPNASGTLPLKYSAPIGHASKFEVPGTDSRTGLRRQPRRQGVRLRPAGRGRAQRRADRLRLRRASGNTTHGDGARHRVAGRHDQRDHARRPRSARTRRPCRVTLHAATRSRSRCRSRRPRPARSPGRCRSPRRAARSRSTCTARRRNRASSPRPTVARLRRRAGHRSDDTYRRTSRTPARWTRRSPGVTPPHRHVPRQRSAHTGQHHRGRRLRAVSVSSHRRRTGSFTGTVRVATNTGRAAIALTGSGRDRRTAPDDHADRISATARCRSGARSPRPSTSRTPATSCSRSPRRPRRPASSARPRPFPRASSSSPGQVIHQAVTFTPTAVGAGVRHVPDHRERRSGRAERDVQRHAVTARRSPFPGRRPAPGSSTAPPCRAAGTRC